ncbi:hypothetical protein BmR1_04g07475 [Babesia microti strain RI]|uniref:Coiled-coil domain-containing protein 86 n=1 Tax=Babesia microti (strain RI) TaxID=1133968 RepID=I7IHE8_BABMR|nr:hypothetical protein BmR1_04g07475 [Babesia microti strain RI]CCF75687.1 hypothetical protein BmR1_04g07475 [Babesia microti strain RI]|eukprot:XP_012650095.1 hypothetical protein BmR1_04g07475 [Babesia microti strain RI]
MYDKPISVEQNAKYIEVEGIPVSGRTWKDKALPIRTKMMIKNSKKKWLEQQQMQRHMKLVSLEAKQLIENRKEEIRLKRQRRLEKQSKKVENEIRAAGPNAIVLSNKKVSKMSKKAKKQLMSMTPELISKLRNRMP